MKQVLVDTCGTIHIQFHPTRRKSIRSISFWLARWRIESFSTTFRGSGPSLTVVLISVEAADRVVSKHIHDCLTPEFWFRAFHFV